MENKRKELNNLSSTLDRVQNEISNAEIPVLQAQNSSLQSQKLNSQTRLEHSQSQLTIQQNANHTISDRLADLQGHWNDLSREAHIKQGILNALCGVIQNNGATEPEGVMLENRVSLVKDSILIDVTKDNYPRMVEWLDHQENLPHSQIIGSEGYCLKDPNS